MESKSYIITIILPLFSLFIIIYSIIFKQYGALFIIMLALITGLLGLFVGKQKKRNEAESFAIGFLFSFIGVIILALLSAQTDTINKKNCPYCKELIYKDAIKCPFCQSELDEFR